jgi:asparagine synthase (glutamine-hydrolysing)
MARWLASKDQTFRLKRGFARLAEMARLEGSDRIIAAFLWTSQDRVRSLMASDVREQLDGRAVVQPLLDVLASHEGEPAIEQCLALEQRFFLADHNLIYTDKMAMAAGVEMRVPLLDLELVDFAATIPVEWKLRGMTTKWILRRSQRGTLPSYVINRPKTGFGVPLRRWLLQDMRDFVGDLLSPDVIARRGMFDPATVAQLIKDNAEGRIDGTYTMFALMCLELWCREFLDRHATIGAGHAFANSKSPADLGIISVSGNAC